MTAYDRNLHQARAGSGIDPITLAVLRGAFEQVAEEMDTVIAASAVSPVIADAWDRASGVFHPQTGEVIAQGATGLPIFIIVMQHTVQEVLKSHPPETMRPGDVFIVNDPYRGGTHTMDMKFVKPYFRDGKLLALLANTGHWPDVGGMTPGGFTPASTDIYQEGLRFPPIRLYDGGRLNEAIIEIMLANMRVAEDRRGDMAAQINALDLGCRQLDELFERYDENLVFTAIDELKARSEALMRSHIAEIPDGSYHFQDWMDNDGVEPEPLLIDLEMTVAARRSPSTSRAPRRNAGGRSTAPTARRSAADDRHQARLRRRADQCRLLRAVPLRHPGRGACSSRARRPVSATTTETAHGSSASPWERSRRRCPAACPPALSGPAPISAWAATARRKGRYATIFFFGGGMAAIPEGTGSPTARADLGLAQQLGRGARAFGADPVHALRRARGLGGRRASSAAGSGSRSTSAARRLLLPDARGDRGRTGPHGLEGGAPGAPASTNSKSAARASSPSS
jgi:N-methylhydantoinase B